MNTRKKNKTIRIIICVLITIVLVILGIGCFYQLYKTFEAWWTYDSSDKFIIIWLWDKTWLCIKMLLYLILAPLCLTIPFALPWKNKKRKNKGEK